MTVNGKKVRRRATIFETRGKGGAEDPRDAMPDEK